MPVFFKKNDNKTSEERELAENREPIKIRKVVSYADLDSEGGNVYYCEKGG